MTTPAGPNPADDGDANNPPASVRLPTREEVLACQFHSWYGSFRDIPPAPAPSPSSSDGDGGAAGEGGGSQAGDEGDRSRPRRRRRRKRRKNVTIESAILPLPPDFVEYLLSDGVRLPEGAEKLSSCADGGDDGWSSDGDDDGRGAQAEAIGEEDTDSDSDSEEEEENDRRGNNDPAAAASAAANSSPRRFAFPELNDSVASVIERLGGSRTGGGGVLPKLNWSAPRDAAWMNGGTMKCRTPGDVYLLLKSSDFVAHDVLHAFDELAAPTEDPDGAEAASGVTEGAETAAPEPAEPEPQPQRYLVLRKWCNLHPSMEFRCFVKDRTLIAISQRNHTQHYPHLVSPEGKDKLLSLLEDFFLEYVRERYPVTEYVFDAYVDKSDRTWLIDFNVWGTRTDALLFEWEELAAMGEVEAVPRVPSVPSEEEEEEQEEPRKPPEMRVVTTDLEVKHDPLASYRAPIDTVDLAGGVSQSFEAFMAMCERPSEREDDDDDDEEEEEE